MNKTLIAAVTACLGASAHANLLLNGDFELGPVDWTQVGNFPFGINNSPSEAHSGNWLYNFGAQPGTLSQTITTTIGQTYVFSAYINDRSTTAANFSVEGRADGNAVFDAVADTNGYVLFSGQFTATQTSTVITLATSALPSHGVLDDVSVETAVPEPASLSMLGVGVLAIYLRRRRSR